MQLSLSSRAPARIEGIELQTSSNRPFSRRIKAPAGPEVTELTANGSSTFGVQPQVEFELQGNMTIPESLEMIVTDQFKNEHIIRMKDGEHWPPLPPLG
jgi:hypothetical protein